MSQFLKEKNMTVKLLAYTPEPEKVVACAAKECYSSYDPDKLMEGLTDEKVGTFLDRLSNLGHASPTEMAVFTFSISGVSRSLLAQLSRHRLASMSVRSQRYVSMDSTEFVEPEAIKNNGTTHEIFNEATASALFYYKELKNELVREYIENGMNERDAQKKAQEDARYVLPEATQTSLVLTMNARELNHFFSMRCCNRAQLEIRNLADEMLKLVYPIAPHIFAKSGPNCVCGTCTEGGMSCGKAVEVKDKYSKLKESLA
jgi:thymidylate synthase (FAD)